uniref:Uncharacterized protein n=1 Tax=Aegilops tauschii subsp. strangulata TaxID=200361 RepID=A0A452YUV6_AEGTS
MQQTEVHHKAEKMKSSWHASQRQPLEQLLSFLLGCCPVQFCK